jgi:hypothetical protein
MPGRPVLQGAAVKSLSSAIVVTPPLPSQTFLWQSPAVCWVVGVPAGVLTKPQVPTTQLRERHSVSEPGQSVAKVHWGAGGALQRRLVQMPEQHCLAFVQLEPSP